MIGGGGEGVGARVIEGDVGGERIDELFLSHERASDGRLGRENVVRFGHFLSQVAGTMTLREPGTSRLEKNPKSIAGC